MLYAFREGGLGIKSIRIMNEVAIMRHLWNILSGHDTIWTKWINKILLKGNSLWTVECKATASWTWKAILKRRSKIQGLTAWVIGNGKRISFWFDKWRGQNPLKDGKDVDPWNHYGISKNASLWKFLVITT